MRQEDRIIQARLPIACALKCLIKAHIVEYIKWSCSDKNDNAESYPFAYKDGEFYMWDSYKAWHRRLPWLGESTLRKHLAELRKNGWLITAHLMPDPRDRTLFYRVNQSKIDAAYESFRQTYSAETALCMCSNLANGVATPLANGVATPLANGVATPLANASLYNTKSLTKSPTKSPTKKKTRALSIHTECTPFDQDLAKQWIEFARGHSPNGRFNEIKFAEAIMKFRTKFQMTEEQIAFMFNWIKNDTFWCINALSPASMLKPSRSYPDITKLEQIINQIKNRKKTQSEKVYESILKTENELDDELIKVFEVKNGI